MTGTVKKYLLCLGGSSGLSIPEKKLSTKYQMIFFAFYKIASSKLIGEEYEQRFRKYMGSIHLILED